MAPHTELLARPPDIDLSSDADDEAFWSLVDATFLELRDVAQGDEEEVNLW